VVAYFVRSEQVIMDALAEFHIAAGRIPGCTGVWVEWQEVAAIGVHISRWVTSHGFALNHTTDLRYFQYIVPLWVDEAGHIHARTGIGLEPRTSSGRVIVLFCETVSYGDIFMTDVVMPQMGRKHRGGYPDQMAEEGGEHVDRDEPLFEISTDKVDTEIPSPAAEC